MVVDSRPIIRGVTDFKELCIEIVPAQKAPEIKVFTKYAVRKLFHMSCMELKDEDVQSLAEYCDCRNLIFIVEYRCIDFQIISGRNHERK